MFTSGRRITGLNVLAGSCRAGRVRISPARPSPAAPTGTPAFRPPLFGAFCSCSRPLAIPSLSYSCRRDSSAAASSAILFAFARVIVASVMAASATAFALAASVASFFCATILAESCGTS